MKNWTVTCAALAASAVALLSGAASAATIDYIFTGAANFTLNGVVFSDAPFTLTYVGDTTGVTGGGGEAFNSGVGTFVSGATTVTLTGDVNEVIVNPGAGLLGFGQIISSPFSVNVEAISNSAFGIHGLGSAFPLTSGSLKSADSGNVLDRRRRSGFRRQLLHNGQFPGDGGRSRTVNLGDVARGLRRPRLHRLSPDRQGPRRGLKARARNHDKRPPSGGLFVLQARGSPRPCARRSVLRHLPGRLVW